MTRSAALRYSMGAWVVAGLLGAGTAMASPFGFFDARMAGMSNVGVATSDLDNGAFFNPALLVDHNDKQHFGLLLPTAGAYAADPDGLTQDVQNFQNAVNAGNTTQAQTIFNGMLGKSLFASANVAGSAAFGTHHWAVAVSENNYLMFGLAPTGTNITNAQLQGRGYQATEVGVSGAYRFGNLSVGVTPKSVSVQTYDYSDPLSSASTSPSTSSALDQGSSTNLDVGIAYNLTTHLKMGVVGRNLISRTYQTALGNTIEVNPQYRAGFAYDSRLLTAGVDCDLTDNNPVSFEGKTQMLAVGAEFNAFDWAQLRMGYTVNLAGAGQPGYYSAGLGLSPFGAHLDLAVSGNSHSIGAFAQFGFHV